MIFFLRLCRFICIICMRGFILEIRRKKRIGKKHRHMENIRKKYCSKSHVSLEIFSLPRGVDSDPTLHFEMATSLECGNECEACRNETTLCFGKFMKN